jgi:leader peptidase (prepilin peptidase)/N-methyltransferase
MTSHIAPVNHFSLVDVIRLARPVQVLAAGLLLILAFIALGPAPGLATALWLAIVTPSLVAIDIRLKRLPNVLVVPGLVTMLADTGWATAARGEIPALALVTTAIVVAAMFALNLAGGLGMGDVKLSAVIAGCLSLVSPWLAIGGITLAFFLGGAYSAALMLRHRGHHGRRIAFGPLLLVAFWAAALLLAVRAASVVSAS